MSGTMPDEADFLAILEAQRAEFRKTCRDRFEALRAAWARVAQGADREALRELLRQAHTLAGTGPTFGFDALGDAAREVQAGVEEIDGDRAVPTDAQRARIDAAVAALQRALPDPE